MSIQPVAPHHFLTVAEYLELGEVEPGYSELVEGRLLMSPSPLGNHSAATLALAVALQTQLPAGLEILPDIDVDLQLAPADAPGTVRRPDLIVVSRDARRRQNAGGGLITASDVLVAIEIVSPGSVRTDQIVKRGEYADAGIPHYWIVDLRDPVSLVACHLAGELGYVDGGVRTGTFAVTEPFPAGIDLDALL